METMTFDAARERSQKPFAPEAPYDRFRMVARTGVEGEGSAVRPWDEGRFHRASSGFCELKEFNVNLRTL